MDYQHILSKAVDLSAQVQPVIDLAVKFNSVRDLSFEDLREIRSCIVELPEFRSINSANRQRFTQYYRSVKSVPLTYDDYI